MSRFAFTYEDPEYEVSDELLDILDDDTEQEVMDEEIYSPYYGA
jgi:hypothetical protein